MAELIGPRITGLEHRVEEIRDAVERSTNNRSSSHSEVEVHHHHDGKGTWVSVTVVLMLAVMNIGLGFLYLDMRRSQDRSDDYIQTTYMLVPGLRKLVDDELERRKASEEKR